VASFGGTCAQKAIVTNGKTVTYKTLQQAEVKFKPQN